MNSSDLATLLTCTLAALVGLVVARRRGRSPFCLLGAAFAIDFFVLYLLGAVVVLVRPVDQFAPAYAGVGRSETLIGACFCLVCLLVAYLGWRVGANVRGCNGGGDPFGYVRARESLPPPWWGYLGLFVFAVHGRLANLPIVGAASAYGVDFSGLWFALYFLVESRRSGRAPFVRLVVLPCILTLAVVIANGFLGYGFRALIPLCFAGVFSGARGLKRSSRLLVITGFFTSLGLAWFAVRDDLRLEINDARAGLFADGVDWGDVVARGLSAISLEQLEGGERVVLARANQAGFVGLTLSSEGGVKSQVADGDWNSIELGLLNWVPRYFWPSKPSLGGSGELLIEATGLTLDRRTSWGIGSVIEFYMAYGVLGVMIFFLVAGFVLGACDQAVGLWVTSGSSMTQVLPACVGAYAFSSGLNSFAERFAGAILAVLLAAGLLRLISRMTR